MSDDLILNLDGLPFPTQEWAERMRRLLERETGQAYVIETIPNGFGLRRAEAVGSVPLRAVRIRAEPSWPVHTYRPAVIRANLWRMPLLMLGIALALGWGSWLLSLGVSFSGLSSPALGPWWSKIADGLVLAGRFLVVGILLVWWVEWISAAYTVSDRGVEARIGVIARDIQGLRFQDIRQVVLRQSLYERLVGIGTLEFSSAGTNDRPVRFLGVARPLRIKAEVEDRMRTFGGVD